MYCTVCSFYQKTTLVPNPTFQKKYQIGLRWKTTLVPNFPFPSFSLPFLYPFPSLTRPPLSPSPTQPICNTSIAQSKCRKWPTPPLPNNIAPPHFLWDGEGGWGGRGVGTHPKPSLFGLSFVFSFVCTALFGHCFVLLGLRFCSQRKSIATQITCDQHRMQQILIATIFDCNRNRSHKKFIFFARKTCF